MAEQINISLTREETVESRAKDLVDIVSSANPRVSPARREIAALRIMTIKTKLDSYIGPLVTQNE